jgi:DNA-binding Xre family transcriptional regulator
MIQNRWKKMLEKSGITQAKMCDLLGVNSAVMSMAVCGIAMLELDALDVACAALKCKPSDIYADKVLSAVYGLDDLTPKKKRHATSSVRIPASVMSVVDTYANGWGMSRQAAVHELIMVGSAVSEVKREVSV